MEHRTEGCLGVSELVAGHKPVAFSQFRANRQEGTSSDWKYPSWRGLSGITPNVEVQWG